MERSDPASSRRLLPLELTSAACALVVLLCACGSSHEVFEPGPPVSRLIAAMGSSPHVRAINVPHATVTATYYGSPQGYFHEEDPRFRQWWLRTAGGDRARLVFPPADLQTLRIEIGKVVTKATFDIQPNFPRFQVVSQSRYALRFRARSDRPRHVFVGFARAHGSWETLGLYEELLLTPQWRSFEKDFLASENDDNARIFFDLGSNESSVEISGVALRSLPDGASIHPKQPPGIYTLTYRFNGMGCRGPDRSMPKPSGINRILLLGNAFTLGEGIPEDATFSSQLERLLNTKPASSGRRETFEVINCGAVGYGTREERLFYESTGVRYQAATVVVVMTTGDDLSFGEGRNQGPLAGTFTVLFRHRRPSPNFDRCVKELLQLNAAVRRSGAELIVFIFRNNADFSGSTESGQIWNQLTETITQGLRGTGIPVIDLGRTLEGSSEALKAHSLIGFSPNETAHALAAEELLSFFQRKDPRRP